MNPVPLAALRLRPRHHLSALWWLALLYRRPTVFHRDLEHLGRGQRFAAAVRMYLHGLPYVVAIAVLGRLLVFGAFGIALGIGYGIAFGISGGMGVGIALGIAFGTAVGIALRIALGIAFGTAFGTAGGMAVGIASGLVGRIAFGTAGGIAVGIASTRAYYLVGHPFFVWPRLRGDWYRQHPVAWDDLCGIPFPGLCRLLADYARFDRPAAEAEIERLIDTSELVNDFETSVRRI